MADETTTATKKITHFFAYSKRPSLFHKNFIDVSWCEKAVLKQLYGPCRCPVKSDSCCKRGGRGKEEKETEEEKEEEEEKEMGEKEEIS